MGGAMAIYTGDLHMILQWAEEPQSVVKEIGIWLKGKKKIENWVPKPTIPSFSQQFKKKI